MGQILRVDLTERRIWSEPLNVDYARRFLGGSGLGARYLWDFITQDTDPLGPDNPLIFMTGPLVGTSTPAAGRFSVVTRSPQTGLTGEGNSGGYFGPAMRQAGYDGIIITGQASSPVYLSIVHGSAQLHDAAHLWGLDSYEVQERIKAEIEQPKARVACIGVAGEKLVKYAAVMNDHGRCAARTGLGAVMGSKNLKAIAAFGRAEVPLADAAGFKPVLKATMNFVIDDLFTQALRLGGTVLSLDVGFMYGDVPRRYFTAGESAAIEENVNMGVMADTMLTRHLACFRCPIACNREVHLDNYGEPLVDGPEYETMAGFSSNIDSADMQAAAMAGHLCNKHGLDTISASNVIGLLYYLYNEGLASAEEIGMALPWGDPAPAIRLVDLIAQRAGIGDLAAEGAKAVATHFGVPELAVQVKNLEMAYHDPRAFIAQGLIYATASRGADHMAGDCYEVGRGRIIPELGMDLIDRHEVSLEQAAQAARVMDFRSFTNSAILCHFEDPQADNLIGLLHAVTGIDVDYAWIARMGERITNLKRVLNNRLGATRADDTLPKLVQQALTDSNTQGATPALDELLPLYYEVRGWDWETGRPCPEKLLALDLGEGVGSREEYGVWSME
jgi:aldehyde:ferredoxin oxidoreductase